MTARITGVYVPMLDRALDSGRVAPRCLSALRTFAPRGGAAHGRELESRLTKSRETNQEDDVSGDHNCKRDGADARAQGHRSPGHRGTSGIGQAIAVKFAEFGANVAINYLRQPDEAAETEQQVHSCVNRVQHAGVRNVLVQGDLSQEDDVVKMVGHAASELGGIGVLINNAGIQISRPSEQLSSAEFDRVLAVNIRGAFLCARETIRHFLAEAKPGVIINVSTCTS
jgi:hypothetical protein